MTILFHIDFIFLKYLLFSIVIKGILFLCYLQEFFLLFFIGNSTDAKRRKNGFT